jgi:hypothetical protein
MRDIDSNKLEALYESLILEKFTDKKSEEKANELEDSLQIQKMEKEKDKETVDKENKQARKELDREPKEEIPQEKKERIEKFADRTKLASKGSPSKIIKAGKTFTSRTTGRDGKEMGYGQSPYVRSHIKTMPEDVTQEPPFTVGKPDLGDGGGQIDNSEQFIYTYIQDGKERQEIFKTESEAFREIIGHLYGDIPGCTPKKLEKIHMTDEGEVTDEIRI